MSIERSDVIKLMGNPLTLIGEEIKVGDKAPDFKSAEGLGKTVDLNSFEDKIKIFNVIVSVDTPVCDVQTKKFNEEAASLSDNIEIVTVSMDLPFALNRYCGAAGIDKVRTISDYHHASFGEAYGVLIKENRLLCRALFVVDSDNIVRHVEYVGEVSEEPNYEAALEIANSLVK